VRTREKLSRRLKTQQTKIIKWHLTSALLQVPVEAFTSRVNDVLSFLKKNPPHDAFCVLAITMEDLVCEDGDWVFGETSSNERVGVCSFARHDPMFYGEETILNSSRYQPFAYHWGNIRPDVVDERIKGMTKEGVVVDCNGTVPNQARGAIVHVMVARRSPAPVSFLPGSQWETLTTSPGATFVAADSLGHFYEKNLRGYQANSFSNSASTWIGGLVFCPFYEEKKFKYLLESGTFSGQPYGPEIIPDPSVGCIATVVGWF
jgi:hypothetical protein